MVNTRFLTLLSFGLVTDIYNIYGSIKDKATRSFPLSPARVNLRDVPNYVSVPFCSTLSICGLPWISTRLSVGGCFRRLTLLLFGWHSVLNLGAKIMLYYISCIVLVHNLWLIKV